ncbi:hypothetical protein Chor_011835 [Crotalus horridus]
MQVQEILRNLRLPEFEDFSQFFRSLPASTLVGIGAFAAIIAYWLVNRPKAVKPPCDLLMQSEEIELYMKLQLLQRTDVENGPCLGFRKPNQPYQWLSYKEVAERAEALGSGLLQKGCKSSPNQFIGVFAQNCPEWIISELACYTYSMVVVPLYDTLGPGSIRYIINTADISIVVCDKPEKARVLLEHVEKKQTPGLKSIILMDPFEKDLKERGQRCGVQIQAMLEVEVRFFSSALFDLTLYFCEMKNYFKGIVVGNAGMLLYLELKATKTMDPEDIGVSDILLALFRSSPHLQVQYKPPHPEDLSIVCFTSGTTGNPKGAMLTHGNVVADFSGFLKVTESQWSPTYEDVHISYLPLAHMFERMVQSVVYCHGGRIGFFQGDIRLLSDDMKALRPTIFPIFSQADTPVKRWLLEFAANRKKAEVQNGIVRNDSLWDMLFFNKIQANLGGCVRMIVTGAAPASPTVLGFLRAALGCQVYEGYGQTECTAGCTFTTPGDWTSGHVGAPLPCNLIKLVDVEELNYFSSKREGEICVKGPNVFKGYLKDKERTAEALDKDGWLHTGDIGKWLSNGTLKIIDRKKHIFKLAQGEYIAPEKIENIYIRSEPVSQIYVHGDSLQAFLVGIVVPDAEVMPGWAKKRGFDGTFTELCNNTKLKDAIMEDMVQLGKESGLYSFEQVKAVYIHSEMFSVQNGLLTPTLKARRSELREYFKKQIEDLYSSISI